MFPPNFFVTGQSVGGGSNAVPVTVHDGSGNPVVGATVQFTLSGVLAASGVTDSGGSVSFALNPGAYAVTVSATNYQFVGQTVNVPLVTSPLAIVGTLLVISPPASPGLATGYGYVVDGFGNKVANVPVQFKLTILPAGQTNSLVVQSARTFLSNNTGFLQATGLMQGATYELFVGEFGGSTELLVPAQDSFPFPQALLFNGVT